jgi:hypothetical protein
VISLETTTIPYGTTIVVPYNTLFLKNTANEPKETAVKHLETA